MRALDLIFEDKVEKITSPEFKAIASAIKPINDVFEKSGFELRIVGGAVRDLVLGKEPKDVDMATDALPDQMIKMFQANGVRYIETGLQHGTLTAIVDSEPYEITTLRIDSEHTGRHATVEFTASWEDDAARRDLTYNAMSMDMNGRIYDYFGGIEDLRKQTSKFVGKADKRIREDYLRIMRYFRFQGRQAEPQWDEKTLEAIKRNAKGLETISGERIWMEMSKILTGHHVKDILTKMQECSVHGYIHLPMWDIDLADEMSGAKNAIVPLAALIKDTEDDVDVSNLHKRWKFSKAELDLLFFLVNHKDEKLEAEELEDLIVSGIDKTLVQALSMIQGTGFEAESYQAPIFPIQGHDMLAVGVKPGPQIGLMLSQLKDIWKAQKYKPTREDLLKYVNNRQVKQPVN